MGEVKDNDDWKHGKKLKKVNESSKRSKVALPKNKYLTIKKVKG